MSDIPARHRAPCAFCKQPLDTRAGRGSYREVAGWEPLRTGGGANKIAAGVRTGRYAHKYCVDLAKRVGPFEQLEMSLNE